MKQIFFALFSIVLIWSCKGDQKSAVQQDQSQTAAVSKVSKVINGDEMFRGMEAHPDNVLGGLKVGDTVEDFTTVTNQGNTFRLSSALNKSPVLLVFYRGHWCPKCTKHLADLEKDLLEVKEYNVAIYAVSPETEENIAKTVEKSSASFPIIHDKDDVLMKKFKVRYKVADGYVDGLEETNNQTEAFLPVPATYLIGEGGKVLYTHYDHNYSSRASLKDILDLIK